jgi:hypothetical protein
LVGEQADDHAVGERLVPELGLRTNAGLGALLARGDQRLPAILTAASGMPSRLAAADIALVPGVGSPVAAEAAAAYTRLARQFSARR